MANINSLNFTPRLCAEILFYYVILPHSNRTIPDLKKLIMLGLYNQLLL